MISVFCVLLKTSAYSKVITEVLCYSSVTFFILLTRFRPVIHLNLLFVNGVGWTSDCFFSVDVPLT